MRMSRRVNNIAMNSDDEFSPNLPKRRRGRPKTTQKSNAAPPKRSGRSARGRAGPSRPRRSNLRRHEIIRVGDASSDSDDDNGPEEEDEPAQPLRIKDTDSLAKILGVTDCDNSAIIENIDVSDDEDFNRDNGSPIKQISELPSNPSSNSEPPSIEAVNQGHNEKEPSPEPAIHPSRDISAENYKTSSTSTEVSNVVINNQGSSSSSSAAVTGPPKKTARRGLAKKAAGIGSITQAESSEYSHVSAVYTQCVDTGHLQLGLEVTNENPRTSEHNDTSSTTTSQSESEGDLLKTDSVDAASKSIANQRPVRQGSTQGKKFYSIDTQEELIDSADVSLDPVMELRSPTPPPEMKPKGKGPVKNRRTKKLNQKLSNALQAINNVKGTLEKLEKAGTPSKGNRRGKRESDIMITGEEEALVKDDIVVKVRYLSTVHRINLNMDESLYVLVERLCEKLGGTVEKHNLCLFLQDQDLVQSNTPRTLGLSVADIIDCHQITAPSSGESSGEDLLNLVIQCRHSRTTTTIAAHKDQPFKEMVAKYAELKGLDVAKLRLSFDGENVNLCHTPSRLDIEDMDMLDIIMC